MSAHDSRTLRLAAQLDQIFEDERREHERALAQARKAAALDARMMAACRSVGAAVDRLLQDQFAGRPEYAARKALERAAKRLNAEIRKADEAKRRAC